MRHYNAKGIKSANFASSEMLRSSDIMFYAEAMYENQTELLTHLAMSLGIFAQDGTKDYIVNGLLLAPSALNVTISTGCALSFSGRYFESNEFGFVSNPGDIFSAFLPVDTTVATIVNSNPAIRRDTIEIRPVLNNYDSFSRQFRDPLSGEITSAVTPTKCEFGIEINVKQGVPGFNAPDKTAGWIKIGELVVNGNSSVIANAYSSEDVSLWTSHSDTVTRVQATNVSKALRTIQRDLNARAEINTPISNLHIANKLYVDTREQATKDYFYDLVIDSNSKLDLWCQNTTGIYKRVLIKTGTWTASALGASGTAGTLLDFTKSGTIYVFAEPQAIINYSGLYDGRMIGVVQGVSGDTHGTIVKACEQKYENFKITLTNTSTNAAACITGFSNLRNMKNCECSISLTTSASTAISYAFTGCDKVDYCLALVLLVSGRGIGFNDCYYMNFDRADITVTGGTETAIGYAACYKLDFCMASVSCTSTGNCYGMHNCNYIANCDLSISHVGANGLAFGYHTCKDLVNCRGFTNGENGYIDYSFSDCVSLINCKGDGNGHVFNNCKRCAQCGPLAPIQPSETYTNCFADDATNACDDTAVGGYNKKSYP